MILASQKFVHHKWDVAAFSIICEIIPVSTNVKQFQLLPRILTDGDIFQHVTLNDSTKSTADEGQHLQLSKGNDSREKKKKRTNSFIEISQNIPAVNMILLIILNLFIYLFIYMYFHDL